MSDAPSPDAPDAPDAEPAEPTEPADPETPARSRASLALRLGALAVLVVGGLLLGRHYGLTDLKTAVTTLQETVQGAGALGVVLFLVVFCVGELIHIPGMAFVFVGVLSYGPLVGGVVSYLAALGSVSFSFAVVRGLGGKALDELKNAWVRRALAGIQRRPVLTVALLRSVLWLTPALNYALALSSLRFRDYLLGSAAGLALPFVVLVALFDRIAAWYLG